MNITLDGIVYNATPTTDPQPTDKTIVLDGITYVLTKAIAGTIEKVSVNGKIYDLKDVEDLNEEIARAKEAERQLSAAVAAEAERAKATEQGLQKTFSKAVGIERFGVSEQKDKVDIRFTPVDSNAMTAVTIPAATTEKAGVMSAADKEKLDNLSQGGGGGGDDDTDVVGLPNDKEVVYNITDGKTKLTGSGIGVSQSYWYIADKPIQDSGCRLKTITFQHTTNANKNYYIGIFRKKGDVFHLQGYSLITYYGDGVNGWHTEVVDVYGLLPYTLMAGDYIGIMTPQYFMGGYKDENPVGWTLPFSAMHDPNNIVKEYVPTATNVGLWVDFTTTGVDRGMLYPYELSKERFLTINTPTPREKRYNCTNDTKIFLLGDSIASDTAVGGSIADHNYDGWQKSLAEILGIPESNIIRGGMPGLGVGWFSGDATWSSGGIKSVVGANPDIIISIVGANDSGEQWTVGTFSGVIEGEPICRDIPFSEATQGQYGSIGAEYFIQNVSWIVQRYLNTYYDLRTLANITDSDSYEDVDAKMSAVKQPRLIICTTLPQNRGGDKAYYSKPENWKRKRDAIVEVCNKYNIECVDLLEAMPWDYTKEPVFTSAVWQNKGIYTMDGLHPNKAGFKVISEIICKQAGLVNGQTAVERGRQLALRSLFIAAGAEYNDTGVDKTKTAPWGETVTHKAGHYYLNGLGDITEEQMVEIYNAGRVMQDVAGIYNNNKKIRTNLPSLHSTDSGYSRNIDGRGMFCICEMLEVAIISKDNSLADRIAVEGNSPQYMFLNCRKVRYISKLSLDGGTSTINMFKDCSSLSHVEISKLSTNLSFSDSPLIDKESILYLIQKNTAKSAITITLHPDAHARLVNDAEIQEELSKQPLVSLSLPA